MYCGNTECMKRANGVVMAGKEFCSIACATYAQKDSSSHSPGIRSDLMETYSSVEHGERLTAFLKEKSKSENDSEINNMNETSKKSGGIMKTTSDSCHSSEDHQNLDSSETQIDSGTRKTKGELAEFQPVKYFEPTISSGMVRSPSLNMINESITQLNSIRKDLARDYNDRKMQPDQALMDDRAVERVKTICMVNSQIVATMKLGLEVVKASKEN